VGIIRQVSLLARESIGKIRARGLDVHQGDFAENLTVEGLDLPSLLVGTKLNAGREAVLEVTQIGRFCHQRCNIFQAAGDCVMPQEGIFVKVLIGGKITADDKIIVI
jgi:MOSC domain-containing protein YiiM